MTQNKYRRLERLFLIVISVIGLLYSFEFGLILTDYPHGGQLVGVVFAIVLIIYNCIIFFSQSQKVLQIFRIINYTYISSMTLYMLTIKIIKHIKGEEAWDYLHLFNPLEISRSEKIFNGYAIGGLLICLTLILLRWLKIRKVKLQNIDNYHEKKKHCRQYLNFRQP